MLGTIVFGDIPYFFLLIIITMLGLMCALVMQDFYCKIVLPFHEGVCNYLAKIAKGWAQITNRPRRRKCAW